VVHGFGLRLTATSKGHRWPSFAVASRFTSPQPGLTEDDILHIPELYDFDKHVGQRDSELLLSYLTAPYLRIPLVLSFFATEGMWVHSIIINTTTLVPASNDNVVCHFWNFDMADRINALKCETLRNLLNSVVFEPYRYLPMGKAYAPSHVPTIDETLLSTPYGLLLNELTR